MDARVAATVQRVPLGGMLPPALRRTCECGGTVGPDGECDACRAKKQPLQRRVDRENERPSRVKSAPREAPKMVSADVSKAIRTACDARCGPLIGGASYGETECEFGGNGEPTGAVLVTVTDTDPCTRPCVDKHEASHAVTLAPVCSEIRACTKKAGQNDAALTKCEDAFETMLYATAPGTECAAYKAEVECLRGRQSRPDCASKDAKPRLAKRLRGAECYRDCFCTAVAAGAAPKGKR
jgi:hypothetical protein